MVYEFGGVDVMGNCLLHRGLLCLQRCAWRGTWERSLGMKKALCHRCLWVYPSNWRGVPSFKGCPQVCTLCMSFQLSQNHIITQLWTPFRSYHYQQMVDWQKIHRGNFILMSQSGSFVICAKEVRISLRPT